MECLDSKKSKFSICLMDQGNVFKNKNKIIFLRYDLWLLSQRNDIFTKALAPKSYMYMNRPGIREMCTRDLQREDIVTDPGAFRDHRCREWPEFMDRVQGDSFEGYKATTVFK